jgi:threonine/homoserine/homoserine lactone efflux protein
MTYELLTALGVFAFVASITPGPNNLMLMASGANFGYLRTIPHMAGVVVGFMVMLFLVGLGLIRIFDTIPASYIILKVVSVVYLVYLAWRIATAAAPEEASREGGKPFTFLQALLFQWVNPKAWTIGLTAITVYAPTRSLAAILILMMVFSTVTIPSISIWTLLGQQLRSLLTSKLRLRVFNGVMAALLIASLYPALISE